MSWKPLFVVGVGRSGTSLLHSALAAHPGIAALPETAILREQILSGRLRAAFAKEGVDGVVRSLRSAPRLERTGVMVDTLVQAGLDEHARFSATRLYEGLLQTRVSTPEIAWVLDKDPRLIERIPQIASRWPEARVIHIIRDPRDVIASKKLAAWSRKKSSALHALIGMGQLALGRLSGPRALGTRYLELRYETLLAEPARTLAAACAFLDLPYEPGILNFAQEARALVADDELSWKKETLGPLLAQNAGKWRTSLRPWEVAMADYTSVPLLTDLGYAPAHERSWFGPVGSALRGVSRLSARLALGLSRAGEPA